ncbi:hypothetical protein HGP14_32795 [Rhizobium sp. P32RR-XVIII]|uniref:caspase family protein n=1 Tax=Rhizobium sp. P32RR-XVIII TaxID=2726738 RepID=UPI0014563870|nr:caspase family protein [Rhizobium sp. P32RR-XVIII]NLS07997.1 hypothetical protein [Rhizobium sp. P32RR-XVIII]
MQNLRFPAFLAAACALVLSFPPQPASAAADKAALVIGNGTYASGHPLAACDQSARDVGGWLRHQGFEVEQVLDASSVDMRKAIGDFVAQVSGAPSRATIIYVCSYAAVANQRLFMLPVDSDPDQPTRLETQGVILKALLNTLAGSNGVLFADLGLQPDKSAADAIDLIQTGLPSGVRLAIVASNNDGVGTLGRSLPDLLSSSGQDWARLSAAFQARYGSAQENGLGVFAPLSGPIQPALDAGDGSASVPFAAPSAKEVKSTPTIAAQIVPLKNVDPAKTGPDRLAIATRGSTTTDAGSNPAAAVVPLVTTAQRASRPDQKASRIQAALARGGFYGGPINGRLDARTKHAIRAFQRRIGDAPSGVLTRIQIAKLLNIGR